MAPAFTCSAIVRVGSHSYRGRYLPPAERAKLCTESDTADSGDQADAFDLAQALYFLLQRRLFFQDGADGQLEFCDLPLQQFKSSPIESPYDPAQMVSLLSQKHDALFNQLLTRADQLPQRHLCDSGHGIGWRIYLGTNFR